ncbi:hypothetical protein H6G77_16050 [Aulosira sp. FACHB-615]|nr:hypothetical protein [Aulosira sp. FACHB-615]
MHDPVRELGQRHCVTQWHFFLKVAVRQMVSVATPAPGEDSAMVFG